MTSVEHSFDWRGFYFSVKLVTIFIFIGGLVCYGMPFAKAYLYPTHTTVVSVPHEPLIPTVLAETLSTSTSERVISRLTMADVVPAKGKFIGADLVNMELTLFQDGVATATYPILTKGRPGTPYETPSGAYSVLYKEKEHVNAWEQVHMPYSMEFYGNYFIHGWPTFADGTPVASTYSGGCIRLDTHDAAQVYAFADTGTKIFVYDTGAATSAPPLVLSNTPLPALSASSYLVADLDTGDVYTEHNAKEQRPIASVTKLMTALVANETIMFDHKITVPRSTLEDVTIDETTPAVFVVGDLLYPLLMESNNAVADLLAHYYGTKPFVQWMNTQARALDMASTTFADASGISADNVSTPEDLYRLAVYLANKKSFVLDITRTPNKTIVAGDSSHYTFSNFNIFSDVVSFVGGKVGHTTPAQDTMVSVFSVPINGQPRRIAVVVLGSNNYASDTKALAEWFNQSAAGNENTACVSCTQPAEYRKINL